MEVALRRRAVAEVDAGHGRLALEAHAPRRGRRRAGGGRPARPAAGTAARARAASSPRDGPGAGGSRSASSRPQCSMASCSRYCGTTQSWSRIEARTRCRRRPPPGPTSARTCRACRGAAARSPSGRTSRPKMHSRSIADEVVVASARRHRPDLVALGVEDAERPRSSTPPCHRSAAPARRRARFDSRGRHVGSTPLRRGAPRPPVAVDPEAPDQLGRAGRRRATTASKAFSLASLNTSMLGLDLGPLLLDEARRVRRDPRSP